MSVFLLTGVDAGTALHGLRQREPVRASGQADARTAGEPASAGWRGQALAEGRANTGLPKPGCGICRLAQGLSRMAAVQERLPGLDRAGRMFVS
jgi:hypothetical protein